MVNTKYIDEEEKELIQSIKDIDIDKIQNDKNNIETLKKVAQDYIAKQDKQISLRISSEDLSRLKTIASKKGIRYQTLIKSIVHQYINNNEDSAVI
jgi:predicted DNA binding CopG/RHH family protein